MPEYGALEKKFLKQKLRIVGVDEVGRGALAGPVYAGAAILDFSKLFALESRSRSLVRDSKALTRSQRVESVGIIQQVALSYAVDKADKQEVETLGIVSATFLAMKRALSNLSQGFDLLLIDGKFPIPGFLAPQKNIIGGDGSCYSIAAASVLAKVARDAFMRDQAEKFPGYGFETHVGYATREHLLAIKQQGACALHRSNFAPFRNSENSLG